ncbi:MAG: response regulator [Novosphingobium sp.]|nr:response regulator [Novosphingobium sp.]
MSAGEASPGRFDWLFVGLALAASAALIWIITRETIVALVYAAALTVLSVAIARIAARKPEAAGESLDLPDWSVTVAAIDHPDRAIAVTDRAGRLVCANTCFERSFGVGHAPPRMTFDDASGERLTRAARTAWRDGKGAADLLEGAAGQSGRWKAEVERAGRGDDFLIWRFIRLEASDPMDELVRQLDGMAGRVLDRAGICAAIVDPDGTIRAASAGFVQRAIGDPAASVIGAGFTSFLRQEDEDHLSWLREGDKGGALTLYHMPIANPDLGIEPDPDTTSLLMLLVDPGVGIGGGSRESSASVPHLEALLSQLPLGLAMADRDGRLLFANAAFMRGAGKEGEKLPTYPTDLVVREDKGALSDAIRRFAMGPAAAGDIAIRLVSQPEEPVSLSLAGVRGLGEAAVLLGLTDSTEETRLKRQVAQATKMQAVGQLAGGVAHDFNNVLTAILGTCDLMLLRHTPGDSDYDDIQQIRANSNRAASLTRQLLAFSRQQTLRPELLQLPDVVTDVSQMLKRLIGEKIKLSVTHDRNLGPVRADPTQLEQVIVNLCVNARDAMQSRGDGSGRLSLSTKRITASDVRAMRSEIIPAGEYTALIVADTGGGIAPDVLGKIFEPFFTTKEQGKGTGLGLSTVYGIVKQSGGFIFADSEMGRGTAFTVYLPVHNEPVQAAPAPKAVPAEPEPSEWSGGGKLLLVEDEDPVRLVAERALTRAGFTVTTASDGEEGLEIVRDGGEFDLVVSDVVMPVMDGPTMARKIRELAPDMPVLFMSGYAEEQLRREIDIANMFFIPKPFSVKQISEKVGELLRTRA